MKNLVRFLVGISLLFAVPVFAATIAWDHDCAPVVYEDVSYPTRGFYVYFSDEEIENPRRTVSVDCPSTQAVVFLPGRYSVTAYNDNGESAQSNNIELAQYYYNAIKLDYTTEGRVEYRGEHTTYNAATDDPGWVIKRYYYDGNGRLIDIKIRTTSWDGRAVGW